MNKKMKIFLGVFLLILAVVVTGIISYFQIKKQLYASLYTQRQSVSLLSSKVLAERFDRVMDLGLSLSTRVKFRQYVADKRWEEAISILEEVPGDFNFIDHVFITDTIGNMKGNYPELEGVKGKNLGFQEWYTGVMKNREPYLSSFYKRIAIPNIHVISAAFPVFLKDNKKVMNGILVMQISIPSLLGWMKEVSVGKDGHVYVVDSKGVVVNSPDSSQKLRDFSDEPYVQNVLKKNEGIGVFKNSVDDTDMLISYHPVDKYRWGIFTGQNVENAFGEIQKSLYHFGVIYFLIFCLCIVFAFITIRNLNKLRISQNEIIELNKKQKDVISQLEFSNKELDSFSYSVSHDLRAPLRAINGFVKIVEEDYSQNCDEKGKGLLKVIYREAARMGQLIDDLLSFSRLGKKEIRKLKIDMNELAREAVKEATGMHEQKAKISIGNLPDSMGEPGLMRQVFTNLISNAIKFSSRKDNPEIYVAASPGDGETVYFVKDNGVGFDMKYYDKLFGVFQRLHDNTEFSGTGIGLAIVKRIILHHGGRVWAEGVPGEGATFYFSLPEMVDKTN